MQWVTLWSSGGGWQKGGRGGGEGEGKVAGATAALANEFHMLVLYSNLPLCLKRFIQKTLLH